jgi:hypothetical protein
MPSFIAGRRCAADQALFLDLQAVGACDIGGSMPAGTGAVSPRQSRYAVIAEKTLTTDRERYA